MKTTTIIRTSVTGKPVTHAKRSFDLGTWRKIQGHSSCRRREGRTNFRGESFARMRGFTVRGLVFGREAMEELLEDATPTSGITRIPFVDYNDVAIAFVNGTAVVESTLRWGRRR